MDLLSYPDMPVFEMFEDVDLAVSFWSILKPAIPISIVGKPVLSGTGCKNLIPRFRPREFIFEFSHDGAVSSDGVSVDCNANFPINQRTQWSIQFKYVPLSFLSKP